MRTNFFFNSSWIIQLLVGIGLFFCSFFVEYKILLHFISPTPMALLLAVTLECGKVAAIIWHYYLGYLDPASYPVTVNLTSLIFRFGLVALSLLCSMLFFTARLDRPNMEAVRQERLADIRKGQQEQEKQILDQFNQRRTALRHRQKTELDDSVSRHNRRMDTLEKDLRQEMGNVVNGIFVGSRYQEFERLLDKEKVERKRTLVALQERHAHQQKNLDQELRTTLTALRKKMASRLENAAGDDFATDEQAHDRRIIALLKTTKSMFHWEILPLQFVFFFSILVSLLMETGIMLSFATITVAIAPVLHAHHVDVLEKETCRVQTEGEEEKEAMRHESAIKRVRKAGERVINEAEAVYSQNRSFDSKIN